MFVLELGWQVEGGALELWEARRYVGGQGRGGSEWADKEDEKRDGGPPSG